jgi:hypothetical protein
VDDAEKLKHLSELRLLVQKMDAWANKKLASHQPLSCAEHDVIRSTRESLAQLKQTLADWQAEERAKRPGA